MTYPPQPGQPYGQEPGGFPPQSGGYPQLGPQAGGYPGAGGYPQAGPFPGAGGPGPGGFPQQPYGGYGQYPDYGGYPGYGGPQPPKSRKGLWVGLSVGVVVILVALGITGYWKPGFLVSKNSSPGASPEAALHSIVDGLNSHDETALTALTCADADPKIADAISRVSGVTNAKLVSGPTKVSETEYDGVISLTYHGQTSPFTGKLAKENGIWCWQGADDSQST